MRGAILPRPDTFSWHDT